MCLRVKERGSPNGPSPALVEAVIQTLYCLPTMRPEMLNSPDVNSLDVPFTSTKNKGIV